MGERRLSRRRQHLPHREAALFQQGRQALRTDHVQRPDGSEDAQPAVVQAGDAAVSTVRRDSPHPLMHRTESIDYGIVIAGEMTLVLDDGEVLLKPGSVVVQRGTNHAWANRSGRPCRMLFVLVDGAYEPAIAAALARR